MPLYIPLVAVLISFMLIYTKNKKQKLLIDIFFYTKFYIISFI